MNAASGRNTVPGALQASQQSVYRCGRVGHCALGRPSAGLEARLPESAHWSGGHWILMTSSWASRGEFTVDVNIPRQACRARRGRQVLWRSERR